MGTRGVAYCISAHFRAYMVRQRCRPLTPDPFDNPEESAVDRAEALLVSAINSKDQKLVLGEGMEISALIRALAEAGTIKQHESYRRIRAVFAPKLVPEAEWKERLKEACRKLREVTSEPTGSYLVNSQGVLRGNLANAITMMSELPLKYNSFSCLPFLAKKSPWGSSGNWTDNDDLKCAEWCQRNYLNIEKGTAADAAMAIAFSRKPYFHPVLEYLTNLKWDKQPRLDRWLYKYMGCRDDDYTRAVAAKWMMSAIKRVADPNTIYTSRPPNWNQADYTLVFEGDQGKRKSTALRTLAGSDWFSDDLGAEIGHKDAAAGLQGKWIFELAELDAFRNREMTTLKAWLVRREDRFRPSYGRRAQDFPRQNVFCGSTNKDQWLDDETGGRRFWPVRAGEIKVDDLDRDRDQLWAEAFARFKIGEQTYFDEKMEAVAAGHQSDRQMVDAWRENVESWIQSPGRRDVSEDMHSSVGKIYLNDILWHGLGIPVKDRTQATKNRVSRVLTLAGWAKYRETREEADESGIRREFWARIKR